MSTDSQSLDLLSSLWKYYVIDNSTEYFSYNILPFLFHQFAFYLFNLPFILFFIFKSDFIEKFSIHKKRVSGSEYGWMFFRVLVIQHLVAFPFSLGAKNLHDQTGAFSILLPLPTLGRFVVDIFICMILDDLFFYIGHRLFHTKFLYKQFHSKHHEARYTVSIASEFFHPVEYIIGIVLPVFLPPLILKSHMITYLSFLAIKLYETTFAHCGYDFGPFFPNAREHSYHHSHFENCYGSFFNIWDRLLGTNAKFLKYEESRIEKEKKKQQQ
eukprot:gene3256-5699_t